MNEHHGHLRRRLLTAAAFLLAITASLPVLLNAVLEFPESRDWIAGEVRSALGRELHVDGEIRLNVYTLTPGLRLTNVRLANAPWASQPDMLVLDYFDVHLSLVPLLTSGELVFRSIELGGARIYLEQDGERANWDFRKLDEDSTKPAAGRSAPLRLLADAISVRDARIEYRESGDVYVLDVNKMDVAFAEDGEHMYARGRLDVRYGKSDLRGGFDVTEDPLTIRTHLRTNLLDVDDFLTTTANRTPAPDADAPSAENPPLPFDRLRAATAEVEWNAQRVKYRETKLSDMQLKTKLADGRLVTEQLQFDFAGGTVTMDLQAAAGDQSVDLRLKLKELSLKSMLQAAGNDAFLDGPLSLDVSLHGSGPRLADLRRSLHGRLVLELGAARIEQPALFRMTGPSVASEVRSWAEPLPDLRCMVLGMDIAAGRGRSDVFLLNTNQFTLSGSGYVDLFQPGGPRLVLMFDDRHLSLLDLADHLPIHIGGTFVSPEISVWQRDDAEALFKDVLEIPELPVDLAAHMLGYEAPPQNLCAAARAKAGER